MKKTSISIERIKNFWNKNPLSSADVDETIGTPEFFQCYDKIREINEPIEFARKIHEYRSFKNKRVLEVGCGNAYTLAKYAESGAEVYGLDVSDCAIRISRKRFEQQGLKGNFFNGAAENLPYPDDYFDCICSMGVLHHVHDTHKAIAEIYRCLKPDGRFIIMLYHRNSIQYRILFPILSKLTGKSLQILVNEVDGVGNPRGDVYSKAEMKKLLEKFKNTEITVGLLAPNKLRKILPEVLSQRLAAKWGWFLYAKTTK